MIDQKFYKLRGHKLVECTREEWAHWRDKGGNLIRRHENANYLISTVLLDMLLGHEMLTHGFIFESMVFDKSQKDEPSIFCNRYDNIKAAIKGHKELVREYILSKQQSK